MRPRGTSSPVPRSEKDKTLEGSSPDDTEILDDEPKNMLLALASQLRIGMDLSKITLPVFVLEPRSMLERITDFHAHPELLHNGGLLATPEERFIQVLRYYLAGWHVKPKGVKKPYNPVLGEIFRCRYDYPDGTVGYYVAEQVSHHPPMSAWAMISPENNIETYGEMRPKSRFLGNSAATIMEGTSNAKFLDRPEDGVYSITMPNMYARGILFGKMVLELGDQCYVKNENHDYVCDLDFKTKGFFSGTYNAIVGKIKGPKGADIGEVTGKWTGLMELTRKNGKGKEVFFDANCEDMTSKAVTPEELQSPKESRRLWSKVTVAIKVKNLKDATDAKTEIEDRQREEKKTGTEEWSPKYFKEAVKGSGTWLPKFTVPLGTKESPTPMKERVEALRQFVYGDDVEPPHVSPSAPSPPFGAPLQNGSKSA